MDTALIILLVITGIGILNTLYLTYHGVMGTDVYCLFFPDEWCHKVQHSTYSRTMGIPNPYLGLGMLLAILILIILFINSIIPFWPAMLLITGGFLFSVYFLYIQASVLKAYCTWCVLSFLVFLALFMEGLYIW